MNLEIERPRPFGLEVLDLGLVVCKGKVRGVMGEWAASEGGRTRRSAGSVWLPGCARMLRRELLMSEPTKEELLARIAELEKKTEARKKGALEFRVGEKGGVSVYGLGRFPVTLYYEQWIRLLDVSNDLREFLEENKSRLKLKVQNS
jgi:hypothetical protein